MTSVTTSPPLAQQSGLAGRLPRSCTNSHGFGDTLDATMEDEDLHLLQAFVENNVDLERLTALADRFNVFVAMGAVRQELRHSDFLSFLLDPTANHRLGPAFLSRFLERALEEGDSEVSVGEITGADLSTATVRREWRHVDILIHDAVNRIVCVIENKIGAREHSDQLERYRKTVAAAFPRWYP